MDHHIINHHTFPSIDEIIFLKKKIMNSSATIPKGVKSLSKETTIVVIDESMSPSHFFMGFNSLPNIYI